MLGVASLDPGVMVYLDRNDSVGLVEVNYNELLSVKGLSLSRQPVYWVLP